MLSEGRDSGLTNLLDLPGQTAKFYGWVRYFSQDLNVNMISDGGRGDGQWPAFVPGQSGGGVVIGGVIRLDGFPIPDQYRGERGTVVCTQTGNAKITHTVIVEKTTFKKKDQDQGLWEFVHVCRIVGEPVVTGFGGTQPTAATQSYPDKQWWEGMQKTEDPDGLQTSDTQRWRFFGTGDNDMAENAKIQAFMAALSSPRSTLKLRSGTLHRISASVVTFDTVWSLTTTAEDVINSASGLFIDPSGLQSWNVAAAFNTTPAASATLPYASGAWVSRGEELKEYNDNQILHTVKYGVRSTKSDEEMPGTQTRIDQYGLNAGGQITQVTTSVTPPSTPATPATDGVYVHTVTEQLDNGHYKHTFIYGPRTTKDEAELPRNWTEADPNNITSRGEVALIDSLPSVPGSYKLRSRKGIYQTTGHLLNVAEFALRSTADDITMGETVARGDWQNPNRYTTCTLADDTSSAADYADALVALYGNDATFEGVEVRKLSDGKTVVLFHTRNVQTVVEFEMRATGTAPVAGRLSGGDVYVFVRAVRKCGTGRWEGFIVPQYYNGVRMYFTITKRISTGGGVLPMRMDLAGTSNNSAFLGLPTNTVAFLGTGGRAKINGSGLGVGVAQISYKCLFDSLGQLDFGDVPMGFFQTDQDLSALASAKGAGQWVKASTLGFSAAAPLTGADYSGLI